MLTEQQRADIRARCAAAIQAMAITEHRGRRQDPYYPVPARDPLWPQFEEAFWRIANSRPLPMWNWMEQQQVWWVNWQMFLAGVAAIENDAAFIAHSRTDVPALLADADLAAELLAAVRRYAHSLSQGMPKLVQGGAASPGFQAEVEQTAAAWRDVRAILAQIEGMA